MSVSMEQVSRLFQGVVPSTVATVSAEGVPNVTVVSQVHYVDPKHVALSSQFFNKTRRNLEQNPFVCAEVYDPLNFDVYRLQLRYDHGETSGPLFDTMAVRIQAIATHTGMAGVFKLDAAVVFEVLSFEKVEAAKQTPGAPETPTDREQLERFAAGQKGEIRNLLLVSERINTATDLDELLGTTLATLEECFGFHHSMVLLPDESGRRLVTIASHGYGESGVGAEVMIGEGAIGSVAQHKQILRMARVSAELRYARAVRSRLEETTGRSELRPEIPLPGLPDAQSLLVLPLVVRDELVGVLAVESRDTLSFEAWHEAFLQIVANQIAIGIQHMQLREEPDASTRAEPTRDEPVTRGARSKQTSGASAQHRRRLFQYYPSDDCVFVDGEYLIRNLPGRILWKLLNENRREHRTEFTNRELRLDDSLGLPAIRDNLESRLILLRKRLEQKCPDVRLVPTSRGRFQLELECDYELVEKPS